MARAPGTPGNMEAKYMDAAWRKKYSIMEMTWPDVAEWLKKTDICLVPVATCEQHGPHLPCSTDLVFSLMQAYGAAELAQVPVTPGIPIGVTAFHLDRRPGTIHYRHSTTVGVLCDTAFSLIHNGFNRIVFVSGHEGSRGATDQACRIIRVETGALAVNWIAHGAGVPMWTAKPGVVGQPDKSLPRPPWHGSHHETAGILYWNEELVRMDKACKTLPKTPWYMTGMTKDDAHGGQLRFKDVYVAIPQDHADFSETGMIGDATIATIEMGQQMIEPAVQRLAEFLGELKKWQVKVHRREFIERGR